MSALRGLAVNRSGTVAILFGLTLIPLLGFIGGSIDYANAYRMRSKLQSAVDAAALAAGREIDSGGTTARARSLANQVLESNLDSDFAGYSASVHIDTGADAVTATASLNVDTYLLGLFGHHYLPVRVDSTVKLPNGKVELALVLDNSGSMSGSKLSDLKDAANSLTDIVFAANPDPDYMKVGVVPFAASVNIGTGFANASWMDRTGRSSIHAENFDTTVTRWQMLDAMRNVSWGGCVESRPAPHDVTDSTADPSDGDTYFVPLFAPDEPDTSGSYINDYLDDDDGNCTRSQRGGSNYVRQRRTCKYQGERPDTRLANGTRRGPNHLCDSRAILPLTNQKSQVTSAIRNMQAYGGTNIVQGVMWGWRILSPEAPFTEGRGYTEENNTKVMIVMSDGQNFHLGNSTHNQSWYNSYGYHAQGRLGSPSNATSTLRATMNTRTSLACSNAKLAGIVVYTIAFDITDPDTLALLNGCATSPSRAFTIDDGDALVAVFEAIAGEINKLRISS